MKGHASSTNSIRLPSRRSRSPSSASGGLALGADLADQLDKSSRVRSCGDINGNEFCLEQIHFRWQKPLR